MSRFTQSILVMVITTIITCLICGAVFDWGASKTLDICYYQLMTLAVYWLLYRKEFRAFEQ